MATAVLLLVPALWLLGYACGRRSRQPRARGLYLPVGGSVKPRVSAHMKDGGQPQPATGTTARISSYSAHGPLLAGEEDLARQARLSKRIELISYGNAMAEAGASGEPAPSAASGERLRAASDYPVILNGRFGWDAVPPPWPQPWNDAA